MSISIWVFIGFFISVEVCGQADVFKTVQVKEGEVLRLHPEVDMKDDDQIQWSYESDNLSTRIAKMHRGKMYTHYDERFAGRLKIDKTTGVLSISNIRTNESGYFEAFIIINTQISEKLFNVEVLGASHGNTTTITTTNTNTTNTTTTTSTTHPQMKDLCNEGCSQHCGVTEAVVRAVLSGLVGITTAVILVEHLCCSGRGRIQSSV